MPNELTIIEQGPPPGRKATDLPAQIVRAGGPAAQAWTDFFDGNVRNRHSRKAYRYSLRHFLDWCEGENLELPRIMARDVGRYLSELAGGHSRKKWTLAALRRYFRVLVERHICLINPAAEAETDRYDIVEGKRPKSPTPSFGLCSRSSTRPDWSDFATSSS